MATYKTPGVYVEEISTLPPSVADVSTAVPAFIGCTEKKPSADSVFVQRINTLLEYENLFGKANPSTFTFTGGINDQPLVVMPPSNSIPSYLMYYSLSLYFKNGGGPCYIVSIGNYTALPTKQSFVDGLAALEKEDEPTLILLTDAVNLSAADYYDLAQQSLAQCAKLGDRFTILDVLADTRVGDFRTNIGTSNLMYGAAYYPYIQTSLSYAYNEAGVSSTQFSFKKSFSDNGIIATYLGSGTDTPKVTISAQDPANPNIEFSISTAKILTIKIPSNTKGKSIIQAWATLADKAGFSIVNNETGDGVVAVVSATALDKQPVATLASMKETNTAVYNQIKTTLAQQWIILPPSAAIAGIYASVDRDRGVWKAPANLSLSGVIGPTLKITQTDQDDLNIDPTAGKSINAIRAFTGKGTLVWGARTLAGNDNEWRYISVRRLFIMMEESIQKATGFAVFEPNDATTWLKVKAMIENYLYGLWQQGALVGDTPDQAFFVNVGLGKTMTPQDVLEGRMIVEIGAAAVRPAEFIILRFMHKMQEA